MEPIASALGNLESDGVLLSDVPAAFDSIMKQCIEALDKNSGLKRLISSLKSKIIYRRYFIIKNVHLAANLIDPRYRGTHLTRDEKIAASEFIAQLCDSLEYSTDEAKVRLLNTMRI